MLYLLNVFHVGSLAASNSFNNGYNLPVVHSVQCNGTEETIFNCELSFSNTSNADCARYQDASIICQGLPQSCIVLSRSIAILYNMYLMLGYFNANNIIKLSIAILMSLEILFPSCMVFSYLIVVFFTSILAVLLILQRLLQHNVKFYLIHTIKLTVHSLTIVNCTEEEIRLVDGPSANKGRLEVCINGSWATVCSIGFGTSERRVACAQLGYQRYYGIFIA